MNYIALLIAIIVVLTILFLLFVAKSDLSRWLETQSCNTGLTCPDWPTVVSSSTGVVKYAAMLCDFIYNPINPLILNNYIYYSGDSEPIGVVMNDGTDQIVLFRGTKTLSDLQADLNDSEQTTTYSATNTSYNVHSGMYNIYQSLTSATDFKTGTTIIVGHSLGAALAYYLSIDVTGASRTVYAFAPPKAGDSNFAALVENLSNVNTYINLADMVPSLPLSYMPGSNITQYAHAY
jgi:hypothetical protein